MINDDLRNPGLSRRDLLSTAAAATGGQNPSTSRQSDSQTNQN